MSGEIEVVQRAQMIRPSFAPSEILEAARATTDIIVKCLERGKDYGKVPGTNKEALLKPGAERLCMAYNVYPQYEVTAQEIDHDREVSWSKTRKTWSNGRQVRSEQSGTSRGLYRYVITCRLIHRTTGSEIACGIGCCSSCENKYVDRPRDSENTVLKMAQKRAFVAAVLNGFSLSDRFTQDVEEQESDDSSTETSKSPPVASSSNRETEAASDEQRKKLAYAAELMGGDRGVFIKRKLNGYLSHDDASRLLTRIDDAKKREDAVDKAEPEG